MKCSSYIRAAWVACVVALLAACSFDKQPVSLRSCGTAANEQAMTAFKQVRAATNRCATCHRDNQPPLFQAADESAAFRAAFVHLKGDNPRLAIQAGNGHCGALCADGSAVKAAVAEFQKSATGACVKEDEAFAERIADSELEEGRVFTKAITLTGLSTTEFQVRALEFPPNYSKLDPKFQRVVIAAKFKIYGDTGYLMMKDIAVLTPDVHVQVSRIFLSINGKMQKSYRNYADLNTAVQRTPSSATINTGIFISRAAQLFEFKPGTPSAPGDQLQLSMLLKETSDPGASVQIRSETEMEFFTRVVVPILRDTRLTSGAYAGNACVNCHGPNHPKLYMNNTSPATLRASLLGTPGVVEPRNALNSLLILKPADPDTFHPFPSKSNKPLANRPDLVNDLLTWIYQVNPGN